MREYELIERGYLYVCVFEYCVESFEALVAAFFAWFKFHYFLM